MTILGFEFASADGYSQRNMHLQVNSVMALSKKNQKSINKKISKIADPCFICGPFFFTLENIWGEKFKIEMNKDIMLTKQAKQNYKFQ